MRQAQSHIWSQDNSQDTSSQMSYNGLGAVVTDSFQPSQATQSSHQQQQHSNPHSTYHTQSHFNSSSSQQQFMFASGSNNLYSADPAKSRRVSSPAVGPDATPQLYPQTNAYSGAIPNQQSSNFYAITPPSSSSVYDRRQSHPILPTYHNNGQKSEDSLMSDAYNTNAYDMSAYSTDSALNGSGSYQRASYDASSLYPSAVTPTYNAFTSNSTDYATQQNTLARSLPNVMMQNGILTGDQTTGLQDPLSANNFASNSSLKGAAPSAMMTTFNSKAVSSSQKKHRCSICNKRFTRPSSLQTHIYSHTGEKPFKCEYEGCGRQFSVVSNLRRHKKIHSSGGGN